MNNWWNALSGIEQFYWLVAIAASIVFVFVFIINLVIGFDTDTDLEGDVDIETGTGDVDITLFSFKGLTAFFTFFGWAGVLFLKEGESSIMASIYAFIAGSLALVLVGYLMKIFANMTEEGNFSINDSLHQEGRVYLTIPATIGGKGKVQLQLKDGLIELDAISETEELKTGTKVIVTEIVDGQTIAVRAIQ